MSWDVLTLIPLQGPVVRPPPQVCLPSHHETWGRGTSRLELSAESGGPGSSRRSREGRKDVESFTRSPPTPSPLKSLPVWAWCGLGRERGKGGRRTPRPGFRCPTGRRRGTSLRISKVTEGPLLYLDFRTFTLKGPSSTYTPVS